MMKPDGPYDFYQHPNVAEARQCQPVLQGFSEAVSRLLEDWPEHPVLQQVVQPARRRSELPKDLNLSIGCGLKLSPVMMTCIFVHRHNVLPLTQ